MGVGVRGCVWARAFACVGGCVCVGASVCECVYMCVCVCRCVCVSMCEFVCGCECVGACGCVYVCICRCMCDYRHVNLDLFESDLHAAITSHDDNISDDVDDLLQQFKHSVSATPRLSCELKNARKASHGSTMKPCA